MRWFAIQMCNARATDGRDCVLNACTSGWNKVAVPVQLPGIKGLNRHVQVSNEKKETVQPSAEPYQSRKIRNSLVKSPHTISQFLTPHAFQLTICDQPDNGRVCRVCAIVAASVSDEGSYLA